MEIVSNTEESKAYGTAIGNHIASAAVGQLRTNFLGSKEEFQFDPDTMLDMAEINEARLLGTSFFESGPDVFNKIVVNAYHKAEVDSKAEMYMTSYKEWRSAAKKSMEDMLEHYFPDRWEVKDTGTKYFDENPDVITKLVEVGGNLKLLGVGNNIIYTVYIHFPEIVITNSRHQTWTIKDLYIRFGVSHRMTIHDMRGFRATKTPMEYKYSYSHSHMHTTNGWSSFCLGTTVLDTLMAEIRVEYDELKIALFLQSLNDYLSWESLEGGPHISMDSILAPERGGEAPRFDGPMARPIYEDFLARKPKVMYSIQVDGVTGNIRVTIPKLVSLVREVTISTPERLRFPITASMDTIYPSTVPMTNTEIVSFNKLSTCIFTFRGKEVRLIIEDTQKKDIKEDNVEKFADSRVLNYVIAQLSEELRMHFYNDFWYGTIKKS